MKMGQVRHTAANDCVTEGQNNVTIKITFQAQFNPDVSSGGWQVVSEVS